MKRILFFIAVSLLSLTSCRNSSGVNPGSDEVFPSSSNTNTSTNTSAPINGITVPQSASNLITSRYRGYTVKQVEQELEHGATIYKVTIVSGNAKIRLLFDANWNFIGEKN